MKSHRPWLFVLPLAIAFFVAELQWARAIAWDEVEFFRATKWIAEGRVPFRDFWEHHLPLQWYLFAPAAALFGKGPGVASILAMRWVQVPLWGLILATLSVIARRSGAAASAVLAPGVLVLSSVLLVETAVEYRLDVPASACYFAALLAVFLRPHMRKAWIGAGALMAAAVLANMRLAPLVIVTTLLLSVCLFDERRWGLSLRFVWMGAGAAAVAGVFGIWVFGTGSFDALLAAMRQNATFVQLTGTDAGTLGPLLRLPFSRPDFGALALIAGGVAGAVFALREIRRPGVIQVVALLAIAALVIVARHGVQYPWHFQTSLLLLALLSAHALRSERAAGLAALVTGAILVFNLVRLVPFNGVLAYQDAVMREADRRTLPTERVWDGCGFALRREPAYRYWFMPSLVRMFAERRLIEPYDARQLAANPPAAIIHSVRISLWLRAFPAMAELATRGYIPLYRDLWIPGLNARVLPGSPELTWVAPRAGRYRVYASEVLAKHPWFSAPLNYALYDRPDASIFEASLAELPLVDPQAVSVTIDGAAAAAGAFDLRPGSVVRVRLRWPRPAAVVVLPEDVTRIFIAPPNGGVM